MKKEIPIEEAEAIANKYDYDQVIILAMKPHETKKNWYSGWGTTFNTDKSKSKFLGKIVDILHHNLRAFYSNEIITERIYKKVLEESMSDSNHIEDYDELTWDNPESWVLEISGKEIRFPKSICTIDEQEKTIEMPEWIAIDRGLV